MLNDCQKFFCSWKGYTQTLCIFFGFTMINCVFFHFIQAETFLFCIFSNFKYLFCWFSTTLFFLPYNCRYNISYRNLIGWEGLKACFDWLSEIDWLSFDQFVFIYIFQRVAFFLSFLLRSRNFERHSSTPFCKDLQIRFKILIYPSSSTIWCQENVTKTFRVVHH